MNYDVVIAGAGIAGASLAAELAPFANVLLLETEDSAGYHSTGRSAAFWSETYGGAGIQPLTTASGPLLEAGGYLEPLGSLHIGRAEEREQIEALIDEFAGTGVQLERVDPQSFVAGLRSEWTLGVLEPSCAYIDAGRLHADYLSGARRAGVTLALADGLKAARFDGGWQIDTAQGSVYAPILVNASGAWADQVAQSCGIAPLGIAPYRRTMLQLKTSPAPAAGSALISHIGGDFYWKPESGGRLWLTPHDEIATEPCDAQPDDLDVAIAIDRFEKVVDWQVDKLEHKWAGLRSFAPDRLPVYGFDVAAPGFFWFAGQGGFGIQTAPAAAKLAASLILNRPRELTIANVNPALYAPDRFSK